MALAAEQATRLHAAGEAKIGTDENYFIDVLSKHSYAHLKAVFDQYEKVPAPENLVAHRPALRALV